MLCIKVMANLYLFFPAFLTHKVKICCWQCWFSDTSWYTIQWYNLTFTLSRPVQHQSFAVPTHLSSCSLTKKPKMLRFHSTFSFLFRSFADIVVGFCWSCGVSQRAVCPVGQSFQHFSYTGVHCTDKSSESQFKCYIIVILSSFRIHRN